MAWIESHTNIRHNYKVVMLAKDLHIPVAHAIGILHCFWHSVLEHAPYGDISDWTPEKLCHYAGWEKEVTTFKEVLLRYGFIESDGNGGIKVHDWLSYVKRYLSFKYRSSGKLPSVLSKYEDSTKNDAVPTVPTEPTVPTKTLEAWFEEVWQKYPKHRRTGRKMAFTHFRASVKSESDKNKILKALATYLQSERVKKGYVQNASTWFNQWADWEQYEDKPTCKRCDGTGVYMSETPRGTYKNFCFCPAGQEAKGKVR